MYESHRSLRDDFEVSSAELDTLVDIAREIGEAGGVLRRAHDRRRLRRLHRHAGAQRQPSTRWPRRSRASTGSAPATRRPPSCRVPRAARTWSIPRDGLTASRMAFDPETAPAPSLQPAHRRMAAGVAAADPAPLAGADGERVRPSGGPPTIPTCYLCPGNRRAGDDVNPSYAGTFVFDNDFAALLPGGRRGARAAGRRGRRRSAAAGRARRAASAG